MTSRLAPHLTPRELEVLSAYVRARGAKGAAAALGMPLCTVNAHLRNMRSSHGGMSITQVAVVHAQEIPLPFGIVIFDE